MKEAEQRTQERHHTIRTRTEEEAEKDEDEDEEEVDGVCLICACGSE